MDEYRSETVLSGEEEKNIVRAPITNDSVKKWLEILWKYRAGRAELDTRIQSAEEWWRLRNQREVVRNGGNNAPGYKSKSAWLHNVIQSKHADAMDSYPEPNILPREPGDKQEAERLSAIIPCVLEREKFQRTYSKTWYSKLKFGTGVYKVIWDAAKLNGLGDISVLQANLLTLYWEPGIEDIQDSRYVFEVNYIDKDLLREEFPELQDRTLSNDLVTGVFPEEQTNQDRENKTPFVSVYYHRGHILHLAQFTPGQLLYASENEPETAERGIYDHGKYPYVFDAMFPIEKSVAGYGLVDLCMTPQMEIDILKTAMVKNAKAGASPRYFITQGSGVNREQFLDPDVPLVDVQSSDERNVRVIEHCNLDGNYLQLLDQTINELRDTSGNTDAATGTTPSGVTAASAIAALQEASGKTSRDTATSGYDAYQEVVDLCIELVRQFYDAPRSFRITGQMGEEAFVTYDNTGIQPQVLTGADGQPDGLRMPVFDIKVVPQKRSAYSKMANNDLALQLYGAGFFNPEQSTQALACLGMMDFDGREDLIKTIQQNGTIFDMLQNVMQWAQAVVMKYQDAEAMAQLQQIAAQAGSGAMTPTGGTSGAMPAEQTEPTHMINARNTARGATVPTEGGGAA